MSDTNSKARAIRDEHLEFMRKKQVQLRAQYGENHRITDGNYDESKVV